MKLEKGKKYRIEELKLFPEWELGDIHNENNIELRASGKSYAKGGVHVTQQILDSWTIEEIRPKLKTGYYTREDFKNVYLLEFDTEGNFEGGIELGEEWFERIYEDFNLENLVKIEPIIRNKTRAEN